MDFAMLALRVVIGLLFFGHGAQKLFGTFGGGGLERTAASFDEMGLQPGRAHASAAGTAEAGGGLLLAAGLLTPLAAAALIAVMTAAVLAVHGRNGLWVADNGFEYNLVLAAAVFLVAAGDAGPWSLDDALSLQMQGLTWAVGALLAGLAGGGLAVLGGRARSAAARRERGGHHPHPA